MPRRYVYAFVVALLALLLACDPPPGGGLSAGCQNATCAPARTPTMPTTR